MSDERTIDKIRALLAKARDPAVSQEEAELFMAKVQELLVKHNLSEDDLRDDGDDLGMSATDEYYFDGWRAMIWNVTAKMYFCHYVVSHRRVFKKRANGTKKIMVHLMHGRKDNAMTAAAMAEYLVNTVLRLARDNADRISKDNELMTGAVRKEFILSFHRGCAARLVERIRELTDRTMEAHDNLPAIYDEAKAFAATMHKMKDRKVAITAGSGFDHGRKAADGVAFDRQIDGSPSGARLAIGSK